MMIEAVALLLASLPLAVPVHGEAEWIQQSREFGWCCGPKDCERTPEGAVIAKSGDVYVIPSTNQIFFNRGRPEDRVFPSIDLDYWWCRYPDGRIRCLFVPPLSY
jgi:hypothetical protein